jgi:hypothetical protein
VFQLLDLQSSQVLPEGGDIVTMLGLVPGMKMEAKWDLISDETGEQMAKWWGFTLGEAAGTHTIADEETEGGDEDPEVSGASAGLGQEL